MKLNQFFVVVFGTYEMTFRQGVYVNLAYRRLLMLTF